MLNSLDWLNSHMSEDMGNTAKVEWETTMARENRANI